MNKTEVWCKVNGTWYSDKGLPEYIKKLEKIKELINKRNSGTGYTSLECIEDIEKLLNN